jgi:hypothetical protein
MHSSARRAGYPSDSSRAERKQTRTRPAGGGPLLYDYVVDRLRHLRHRSWPQCCRALPPGAHHPVPARAEKPSPPPHAAAAVRARCPSVTAPGRGCGAGAVPRPRLLFAGGGDPPPPPPSAAAASRGRWRSGRCPCGAPWVALLCRTLRIAGPPLGPPGGRIARLHRHRGAGRHTPGRRR